MARAQKEKERKREGVISDRGTANPGGDDSVFSITLNTQVEGKFVASRPCLTGWVAKLGDFYRG